MRIPVNAPAIFSGIIVGATATIFSLPELRANILAIVQNDPRYLGLIALIAAPGLLYALLKYEERPGRDKQAVSPIPSVVADARLELEKHFAQFLQLISDQLRSAERHGNVLDLLSGRLDGVTSEAELRAIIQKLIASNEGYRKETADLERKLERAQEHAKELKQRAKKAEKLASIDPLTNVANRRKFDEELAKQVALSHQEETPLCLIMSDIDHFKAVNDKYGHRTGDAVLRQFADLLGGMVRTTDLIARYGGEEFAIVLPRAPLGNAYDIAERIRTTIQNRNWTSQAGSNFRLTASFGIADIRDGETVVDLINRADQMLYEAKGRGRNRTMTFGSSELMKSAS